MSGWLTDCLSACLSVYFVSYFREVRRSLREVFWKAFIYVTECFRSIVRADVVFLISLYKFSTEELRLATGANTPVARKKQIVPPPPVKIQKIQ